MSVFKECELNIVFSGHIHIQDIMADAGENIFDVMNSSFIMYPVQYGKININKDGLIYNTELVDVEKWAEDFDVRNNDLLDFNDFSKDYFFEESSLKTFNELIGTGLYSEEVAKKWQIRWIYLT